jgi:hypothetical protein
MEVENFGRLGRSNIFFGQVGRQIYEVREVEKFGSLWRSGGLERFGGRKHRQDPLASNTFFLQLHVDRVRYKRGYLTERPVHSITVALHLV